MGSRDERDHFLVQLGQRLETLDEPEKIYKAALALIVRQMGGEGGAIVLRHPVTGDLRTIDWGKAGRWEERTVRDFLELKRPALSDREIMAPILADGRAFGVMALRRGAPFDAGAGRWLTRLCRRVAREIALREERRTNRVVDQIKDQSVRELRPQDLFYQILHGLKRLTRYDHSSALLIVEEEGARLVLQAEQIAWSKGKSPRIGRRIKVPEDLRPALRRATAIRIVSFAASRGKAERAARAAAADGPPDLGALAKILRWGGKRRGEPAEGTILIAPLHHEGSLLGLLKIAAQRPDALGAPEAAGVDRVVRHLASVIHNARRALSMEERIIEAEKKHAMADLARAISHDVKNAIGAILPLAQQAREELTAGAFDRQVLIEDLAQIEQSAQICQRIFDGMLQLARSGVRPVERAPLETILETTVSILGSRLKRAGVALEMKVPAGLPEVRASRGGLEQLFLNLFTNALDAMPAGGRLKVQAHPAGERVEVKVGDTGAGIPAEQLRRIHEPFYTTKQDGYGLGLAICRSILWENDGTMSIESAPGRGTIVTVLLPAAGAGPR